MNRKRLRYHIRMITTKEREKRAGFSTADYATWRCLVLSQTRSACLVSGLTTYLPTVVTRKTGAPTYRTYLPIGPNGDSIRDSPSRWNRMNPARLIAVTESTKNKIARTQNWIERLIGKPTGRSLLVCIVTPRDRYRVLLNKQNKINAQTH